MLVDYLGHIFAEGEWRRFGVISQERDRSFIKVDQIGVGQSGGVFGFKDSLEVNGVAKIKDLFVVWLLPLLPTSHSLVYLMTL